MPTLGVLKNILTFVQAKHIAPKSVKHILRFLFTIVMAVAFINGASGSDSTGQENQGYGAYAETAYFSTDTQDIAPELYVLRQMPSANGIRPQKSAKKKNTIKPHNVREGRVESDGSLQLSFFQLEDPLLSSLKDELDKADLNNMTPLQAFDLLRSMKEQLGI